MSARAVGNWFVDRLFQRALYNSLWFVLLAVPWRKPEALPSAHLLAGKIVIDAMNYYPGRDGKMDFITLLAKLQEGCGVADLKMSDYGIKPGEFETMAKNAKDIRWAFGLRVTEKKSVSMNVLLFTENPINEKG